MLPKPHARAYMMLRMQMTSEDRPNEAGAVDGGIPSLFQAARPWPAATDPQRWEVAHEPA